MVERQIEAEEVYTHMRSAEKIAGIYIADWVPQCSAWKTFLSSSPPG
uniref:Uncharacterized protein n=1 Tax=Candidatus Methanophaga sp. ANME-1 ERB7 TaxID=2759913 RepID=A0A7G9ZDC3_9EURY|nr:hypothetical protein DKLEMCON_00039 [Methanosarcinales archaeon ANME-1 ERB7]